MTVHVSVRSSAALLWLCVSHFGLHVVAPQRKALTLDRLAAEFDRHRIDLHVPEPGREQ